MDDFESLGTVYKRALRMLQQVSADGEEASADLSRYRDDPVAYTRERLKENPTPDQEKIMRAILRPPYRVLVPAGHNVGKTFVSACILLWFFETQGPSCIMNSTAPSYQALNEVLWGQIRELDAKQGLHLFRTEATPILRRGPMHYAKGMTADKMGSFTGRHALRNAFIVDEAIDCDPGLQPVIESMMSGDRFFTLQIYNPVDPSSPLRNMEESGGWTVIRLSQDTHPNIEAGRWGKPPPYPSAITLEKFEQQLMERSEPVFGEPLATDILVGWRYNEAGEKVGGEWRRPGFEAECRNLGRWPSSAVNGVWTPDLWRQACETELPDTSNAIQIGVDVARKGDCFTCFCVRRGGNAEMIQSVQGWLTNQVAEYARRLAWDYGKRYGINEKTIPVVIDDTGVGGGVTDQADGYNFVPMLFGGEPIRKEWYYNKRAELWFDLALAARYRDVSFRKLPIAMQNTLRNQALAAEYEYVNSRKKMRPKEEAAAKLGGRSPDEIESLLLAFADVSSMGRERVVGFVR